eukprot:TRINITY_DN11421_c0_g1_i1.p1 TRINITY_DN11421_c0_g1~~TRINITY_DN11421_c0_g1_i1.p1  ORF type:complete len:62 (+),score=2.78 TRINITY_DN11421_c0_g1_i1:30-215(+)
MFETLFISQQIRTSRHDENSSTDKITTTKIETFVLTKNHREKKCFSTQKRKKPPKREYSTK